jgi:hypothetical protein
VFYALLLEPYAKRRTIKDLELPIKETLCLGREDVYKIDYIVDNRQNKDRA